MAKKKEPNEICHACGAPMVRDTRPMTFSYKGEAVTLDQPGWHCTECDESVFVGRDVAVTDPAFLEFKARVDGVLTPAEVRRIRTKLGLSQQRASAILGGGPRSFQKYERGEVGVSQAMSNLLRLLDKDPRRLEEIEVCEAA